tara:strand:- start:111 stop:497 length:387 start_codon:yes stop_codon:yes gene_type:complete
MQFSIQFKSDATATPIHENAQLNELRGRIVNQLCTIGSGKVFYSIVHVYRYENNGKIMATIRKANFMDQSNSRTKNGNWIDTKEVSIDKLTLHCGDVDESSLLNFNQDDYQEEITSLLRTGKSLHKSY